MRMTFLAVMLAACGTNGPGAHDVVACAAAWNDPAYRGTEPASFFDRGCERECETPPANYLVTGTPQCDLGSGGLVPRCNYFTASDGTKGCCLALGPQPDSALASVRFAECAAQ